MFGSGDTDVSVADGITFVFDSGNYSTPRMVSVSAAEDADYLHGTALILAHDDDLRSAGVTVREQDNEPTTGIVYVDDDSVGLGDGMTWRYGILKFGRFAWDRAFTSPTREPGWWPMIALHHFI